VQPASRPLRFRGIALVFAAALLALLHAPQPASATSLPTSITSNQTWTAAGSPYTGTAVTIASGVTVTVEPGAVAKFSSSLNVNGTLDVNGASGNPAVFTSSADSAPGQWIGIGLYSSTSSIDHAVVRYGGNQNITVGSGASPSITNSTVRHSLYDGIKVSAASPTIAGNEIHDNGLRGISVTGSSGPHIYGNTISDNAAGQTAWGGGIDFEICNCSYVTADVDIHDNVVESNGGEAGIRVQTSWLAR
jgi:parallel beta-helix repeat protein